VKGKVTIVGAGAGDPELLTLKGKRAIEEAEIILYAGSLVNPEVLRYAREGTEIHNTAEMDLEEIMRVIVEGVRGGKAVVRLHTGDPSLFGAIGEQMELLEEKGIPYEIIPGVSSFLAAAASLRRELTVPEVSQTVIITRMEGRTPVPQPQALKGLAAHKASLCIFLSAHLLGKVVKELKEGGYEGKTPVAVVYKTSWPEEKILQGTLDTIQEKVEEGGIEKTALIFVGEFLSPPKRRSRLYATDFSHGYRKGRRRR
jgi:precorrin-4/cobalt-precorrin-4 C11-methyltransferase